MTKRIALFNHKGGVNKSTTIYYLGWMLAQQGKRVVLVDADPQCHLTSMSLAYDHIPLEQFYEQEPKRNIKACLYPAFTFAPVPIKPVECVESRWQAGLYLLPGHVQVAEYESLLSLAQEMANRSLFNIPGSLANMLEKTEVQYQADYVLMDLNPSLSAFNQNLLMISDYFIIPIDLDYFSALTIETLAWKFPKWQTWAKKTHQRLLLSDVVYPFPAPKVNFLGTILQPSSLSGVSTTPNEEKAVWVERVHTAIREQLIPPLLEYAMAIPEADYQACSIVDYCLASIPDIPSILAQAAETTTPVFALTPEQLNYASNGTNQSQQQQFKEVFADLAHKVIGLTEAHKDNIILLS